MYTISSQTLPSRAIRSLFWAVRIEVGVTRIFMDSCLQRCFDVLVGRSERLPPLALGEIEGEGDGFGGELLDTSEVTGLDLVAGDHP